MDFSEWKPSKEESNLGQQKSKGIEPLLKIRGPIRYTPVTGRISRAKKGVPVHTCNVCRPVKTFTRAEHLRRHELNHTKPAYPCTFENCERAFNRPDLLARHLYLHDKQGKKTYKSGDSRRRASSESDIPLQRAVLETKLVPSSVNKITTDFTSVNFRSISNSSHEISEKETPKPDIASYSPEPMTNQNNYRRAAQSQSDEVYSEGEKVPFTSYTARPQFPPLNFSKETYTAGLSYTPQNSPWCSSASNSTNSTQSDRPQNLPQWSHRGGSVSAGTIPDRPAITTHWSPNASSDTPQDFPAPPFESMRDLYDTPTTEEVKCGTAASSLPSDLIFSLTAKIPTFDSNMSSLSHLKLQCRSPTGSDSHESPSSKSSNQLSGFETDSNYSEDEFESTEDSNFRWAGSARSPDIFQVIHDEILCRKIKDQDALIQPVLAPLKQAMVERIMTEFWVIFNQEWSASVRKCAGASSTPSPSANSDPTPSKQRASKCTGKRSAEHDDDKSPDEDDDRDPKRPKKTKSQLGDRCDSVIKFACPYRKYNPQKYCIRNWRLCALTPLDSVSRVKGHLYRYHRLFQCARCKEIFQNQEDLDDHFIAVASCERRLIEPAEGITGALEKQLRSRKKTHPDQTEEERWIQIYKILFPGTSVPCAYFEPVQEESMASPDSRQLSNYEEFSRQALPRFFRAALEEAIDKNTQPIEEKLKSQLVDMIRDCQDRVFSTYRSRFHSNTTATPAASMLLNTRLRPPSPDPDSEGQTNLDSQDVGLQLDQPSDILGTFFHEAPAPKSLDLPSKFQLVFGNASMLPVTNAPSELSSISDPSMLYSSNSLGTEYTVATDASNASGFRTQPEDDHPFTYLNESGLKPDDENTTAGTSFDFDPEFPMEDLFVLFSDSGNC